MAKERRLDFMELGKLVADVATGLKGAPPTVSDEVRRYMKELGSLGGKKGGPRRMVTLSKKRRVEIARTAAKTRWASKKKA